MGERYRGDFPPCTLPLDVSGAFAVGCLSLSCSSSIGTIASASPIGGSTTFSSMRLDAVKTAGRSGDAIAASYPLLSVPTGLPAAGFGGFPARMHSRGRSARGQLHHPGTRREFILPMVRNLADGFPLDILAANLLAAFLLGLVAQLHRWRFLSDDVTTLLGAGIMGGMSTFSSFVYGSVVLMSASTPSAVVALVYVVVGLVLGSIAAAFGMGPGSQVRQARSTA